jgi:ribosome-binding protein aMBF1 (putative translation factor)
MTEDDQIPEASMPAENSAGSSEIASDDVAAPAAASGRRPMSAASASPVAVTAPGQPRASDLRPAATPAPAGEADPGSPRDTSARPDKSEKKRTTILEERKPNTVRRIRIERMMSKAELARSANLSVLTIDRVEKGFGCRVDTKRKILEALGLSLADRVRVFGEEE